MFSRTVIMMVAWMTLSACSHQQVYDAVRQNRQTECEKLPPPQYQGCMAQYDTSYEHYDRERKALKAAP